MLHAGHRVALADVGSRTVGLTAVGSAGGHGQFDQVLAGFSVERFGEGDLRTVADLHAELSGEFTSVHFGLGHRVDNVLDCDFHLQAPCLDAVLTYVIS